MGFSHEAADLLRHLYSRQKFIEWLQTNPPTVGTACRCPIELFLHTQGAMEILTENGFPPCASLLGCAAELDLPLVSLIDNSLRLDTWKEITADSLLSLIQSGKLELYDEAFRKMQKGDS